MRAATDADAMAVSGERGDRLGAARWVRVPRAG